MSESQTYQSELYLSFKAIEGDSYRSILRFIEEHSTDITFLPVREYFQLQYAYVLALYQTGAYQRVVDKSEELIELSIFHNIVEVDGEDAFKVLLYKRASSLFHLMEYEACLHVCDQLFRLAPEHEEAAILYEKALYQKPITWISRARLLSVGLFLSAATLIAIEVLLIQYILNIEVGDWLVYARNTCFILGWILLLVGDVGHRAWAWIKVRNKKRTYHNRRQSKQY